MPTGDEVPEGYRVHESFLGRGWAWSTGHYHSAWLPTEAAAIADARRHKQERESGRE